MEGLNIRNIGILAHVDAVPMQLVYGEETSNPNIYPIDFNDKNSCNNEGLMDIYNNPSYFSFIYHMIYNVINIKN